MLSFPCSDFDFNGTNKWLIKLMRLLEKVWAEFQKKEKNKKPKQNKGKKEKQMDLT